MNRSETVAILTAGWGAGFFAFYLLLAIPFPGEIFGRSGQQLFPYAAVSAAVIVYIVWRANRSAPFPILMKAVIFWPVVGAVLGALICLFIGYRSFHPGH